MRTAEERIINIEIPEDFIKCNEPEEATHVFLDGYRVEHIVGGNDSIWGRSITDPDTQVLTSLSLYGPRITAYLRAITKSEPFRVVLEDCSIRAVVTGLDSTDIQIRCRSVSGIKLSKSCKVTIEEETEEWSIQ